MKPLFHDRRDAGRKLAEKLSPYAGLNDVIVLALPRGGVPVAFEVAGALDAPLDLMLVRKLGAPGEEEFAIGAIALPDICVFRHDVIRGIGIPPEAVGRVVARETEELQRRNRLYRHGEPPPDLKDRTVLLIDDGMATGATMRAAVDAVLQQQPLRTVVAVPVTSREARDALARQAGEVICLQAPENFSGVGQFYDDFRQTTDDEVLALLEEAKIRAHVDFNGMHRSSQSRS